MTSEPPPEGIPTPDTPPQGAQPQGAPLDTARPDAVEEPRGQTVPPSRRRLMRSKREQIIAGVGGGIAEYLDVDPVLVRIGFVLLTIFGGGAGILIYIVAWIIMPEESDADARARGERPVASMSGSSTAAILFGVVLIALGALFLLQQITDFDPFDLRWDVVLSIALIVIGVLVFIVGRGGRGLLVTLGVVALALLAFTSIGSVRVDGAFGDRVERPATIAELEDGYGFVFGSLTVDLRDLELPEGETELDISIVFGEAVIRVPEGVAVRSEARTLFGETRVLTQQQAGVSPGRQTFQEPGYDDAPRRLELSINTVFGSTRVTR